MNQGGGVMIVSANQTVLAALRSRSHLIESGMCNRQFFYQGTRHDPTREGVISAKILSTAERSPHVHFNSNSHRASQRIEGETVGVFCHHPIGPKFDNRRRGEL